MGERARAAVRDNAAWCQRVCAAHGVPARRRGDRWLVQGRAPAGYPDVITLRPGVPVDVALDGVDTGPGCSVKDSWSDLDLGGHGFGVLTTGTWLWAEPGAHGDAPWTAIERADLAAWAAIHGGQPLPDVLLVDPAIHLVVRDDGSACAAVCSAVPGVAGVSNLVSADPERAWAELRGWCADQLPGRAVVGWEHGTAADAARSAGLTAVGALRVWRREDG